MVENNVESVRENDRYLETIINRKRGQSRLHL